MTEGSLEHRIRADIGRALHHKHQTGSGSVDVERIATEHGVSQDQVEEQFNWLREQNLVVGPLEPESEQIGDVPASWYDAHDLTDDGVTWAEAGFPVT